ncbi:MAG: hypothetical protein JW881_03375 [Spirochaetales bacterium]|nr:hypothetical protein [Spirochaetales bacterium]
MKRIIGLFSAFVLVFGLFLTCGNRNTGAGRDGGTGTLPPVRQTDEHPVAYINATVEKESGDMYLYLEMPDDYYKKYPEKIEESFNMWELDYYLDIDIDGTVYKGIALYIDPASKNIQYVARDVGRLCHAIKEGSSLMINKDAWEMVLSGEGYLSPKDVVVVP